MNVNLMILGHLSDDFGDVWSLYYSSRKPSCLLNDHNKTESFTVFIFEPCFNCICKTTDISKNSGYL